MMALTGVQSSVAVAIPVKAGVVFKLQARVRFAGQVMTGFMVSKKETVLQMESVQPAPVILRQTRKSPQWLNWCVGFEAVDVLLVPLFGSPKFQE